MGEDCLNAVGWSTRTKTIAPSGSMWRIFLRTRPRRAETSRQKYFFLVPAGDFDAKVIDGGDGFGQHRGHLSRWREQVSDHATMLKWLEKEEVTLRASKGSGEGETCAGPFVPN